MKRTYLLVRGLASSRASRATAWGLSGTVASLITGVLTARLLGPVDRGYLGLLLSVAGLSVLMAAMGTNVSVRRHLSKDQEVNQRGFERISILLMPVVLLVLGLSFIFIIYFVNRQFGNPAIGLAFIGYGILLYLSNQSLDLLNARGLVVLSARTNAFGSFVCAALMLLVWFFNLGLVGAICVYALAAALQIGVARFSLKLAEPQTRQDDRPRGMRLLVRDGVRLLGMNLGQALTFRADSIILGALADPSALGYYSVALTPAALLRLPANAVGQLAMHEASVAFNCKKVLRTIFKLELILLPIACLGWFLGAMFIPILFGSDFTPAVRPFRILLIAELALSPYLVASRALAGGGSRLGASLSGIIGVVVLVVASFFLIPKYAEVGAAWASVVAYSTMSLVALIFLFSKGSVTNTRE